MKSTACFLFTSIVLLACSGKDPKSERELVPCPDCAEHEQMEKQKQDSLRSEPFAVVELFSSEGCSDCPPAEELLNKLTKETMADKSYIYPLAFHVDYWNKLGWKDVFSDSSYSNRQRMYRKAFGNEVVYTPQMIVNGKTEFTGSDEKRMRHVIDSVMKMKPECYFTVHPDEKLLPADSSGKELTNFVNYEILAMPSQAKSRLYYICFAIVERGLITKVSRGENKGRTLQHENVVRLFRRFELTDRKGKFDLGAFQDGSGKRLGKEFSLITFIQDKYSMEIVGANCWNF